MPGKFRCAACKGVFESTSTEEELAAEQAAFADTPDAPMEPVCESCWRAMREAFPTLDARYKLHGL